MSYEQYSTMVGIIGGGAMISFVLVGLATFWLSKRPQDEQGKRRGRPWIACLAGATAFAIVLVGGGAVFLAPYPEHHARYEREREERTQHDQRENDTDRRANLAQCQLYCPDAPGRCGTLNAERCEEQQRQSRACFQRCDERYGPD